MFSHGTRVKVTYWKQFVFLAATRIEKLRYFFFNLGEKTFADFLKHLKAGAFRCCRRPNSNSGRLKAPRARGD